MKKVTQAILIYLVIPLTLLGLLEVAMQWSKYGYQTEFLIEKNINGHDYLVNNHRFSWRFFPKPLARLSASIVAPASKDSSALRIVVLGESAAMGDPDPAFGFSRMIEAMLEARYPDKRIEIYNAAITAINSHTIVEIVKECKPIHPDLYILYMGNNEVIGPFGLSMARNPFFSNYHVIQFQKKVSRTATGRFLADVREKDVSAEWRGLEMFSKNAVAWNDPNLDRIYEHFERNVKVICEEANDQGARVVLSTVLTNDLDCPPFQSIHAGSVPEGWSANWEAAKLADSLGQKLRAIDLYRQLLSIDSTYAETHFRLGKCLQMSGRDAEATIHFAKARDFDALRFRSDSKLNAITRRIGREQKLPTVSFVDIAELLSAQAGSEFFYEHVHLNHRGNYEIAKRLLPVVERELRLNSTASIPLLSDCLQRLGYTLFDDMRIIQANLNRLSAPPFTFQYTNQLQRDSLGSELARLASQMDSSFVAQALDVYKQAEGKHSNDYFIHLNYLRFLNYVGRNDEALKQAEKLYQLLPYEYLSSINMGVTLLALKKYTESEKWLTSAIEINPHFNEAYRDLSIVYEEQQKFRKAARMAIRGGASRGDVANLYNRAGRVFLADHAIDSAIAYFDEGIRQEPRSASLHSSLESALRMKRESGN